MLQEPGVRLRWVYFGLNAFDCVIEAEHAFFPAVFLAFGEAAPAAHHLGPALVCPLLLDLVKLAPILLKLLLDL